MYYRGLYSPPSKTRSWEGTSHLDHVVAESRKKVRFSPRRMAQRGGGDFPTFFRFRRQQGLAARDLEILVITLQGCRYALGGRHATRIAGPHPGFTIAEGFSPRLSLLLDIPQDLAQVFLGLFRGLGPGRRGPSGGPGPGAVS